MPINLGALMSGEHSFTFEWEGETAEITYRTAAYTPALEMEVQRLSDANLPANSTAAALASILIDWDVVDEAGERLGVDVETLSRFPSGFLSGLLAAISAEQRAKREDRKNSGGGSARRGSSGNARTGTR